MSETALSRGAAGSDPYASPYSVPYTILVLGLLFLFPAYWHAPDLSHYMMAIGVGVLIAGGATLVGGLTGFLFGLPRKIVSAATGDSYDTNTNLEQISDWLTKILLGAGLTQAGSIAREIGNLADLAGKSLPSIAGASTIILAEFIYFSLAGFLAFYLWTRVNITAAFSDAERMRKELCLREKDDAQSRADTHAIELAKHQLDGGNETPTAADLNQAITDASSDVRALIFFRAQKQRVQSEYNDADREALLRTIPVFSALADSDKRREYHANYGEIGYALKAATDWKNAIEPLKTAIEIRKKHPSPSDQPYWHAYEGALAVCAIKIEEEAERSGQPSAPEATGPILDNLALAFEDKEIWPDVLKQAKAWLRRNGKEWMQVRGIDLTSEQP